MGNNMCTCMEEIRIGEVNLELQKPLEPLTDSKRPLSLNSVMKRSFDVFSPAVKNTSTALDTDNIQETSVPEFHETHRKALRTSLKLSKKPDYFNLRRSPEDLFQEFSQKRETLQPLLEEQTPTKPNRNSHIYLEEDIFRNKSVLNYCTIPRFCQLNKTHFFCFSSHWEASNLASRPIVVIPLNEVESVRRVNYRDRSGCPGKPRHQFEIILDIKKMKNTSYNNRKAVYFQFLQPNKTHTFRKENKIIDLLRHNPIKKINRSLEIAQCYPHFHTRAHSLSLREKTHQTCKNHLMRFPCFRSIADSPFRTKTKRSPIKKYIYDKIKFESESEKQNYIQFASKQRFPRPIPHEITNTFKWSKRELEWYKEEDKYVFVTASEESCHRWVTLLNFLLQNLKYYEQQFHFY